MLPIYICEDEAPIRQHIASHISNYYIIHQEYEKPEITAFSNPYQLLDSLSNTGDLGIYFLDIQLECDINGLELARKIRSYDPRGFIVFVTSHSKYAPKTFQYQVEALGYLNKGSSQLNSLISKTLTKIHNRYATFQKSSLDNPRLEFHLNRHIQYYFASQLIAIATTELSHKVRIYTIDGNITLSGSLNKIIHDLPSTHFVQCHRSYIVNKNHVKSYDAVSHTVRLSNNMQIPVAREKRSHFQ